MNRGTRNGWCTKGCFALERWGLQRGGGCREVPKIDLPLPQLGLAIGGFKKKGPLELELLENTRRRAERLHLTWMRKKYNAIREIWRAYPAEQLVVFAPTTLKHHSGWKQPISYNDNVNTEALSRSRNYLHASSILQQHCHVRWQNAMAKWYQPNRRHCLLSTALQRYI